MATRQIALLGRCSQDEWVAEVEASAPQLVGAVGLDEVERIATLAAGKLR